MGKVIGNGEMNSMSTGNGDIPSYRYLMVRVTGNLDIL